MNIEEVLDRHQDQLMAIKGVTGVGVGEKFDRPTIVVMVTAITAELRSKIPQHLNGFDVEIEVTGEISAF